MRLHFKPFRVGLPLVALVLGFGFGTTWAQRDKITPVLPGDPFPAAEYTDLNAAPETPTTVDLSRAFGTKPVVLFYWIATNQRSEEMFQELQALQDELGADSLALYGVTKPRADLGITPDKIRERARALDIRVPVLADDDYEIGQRLGVRTVPNVAVIDKQGRLRLANGASLRQVLGYKLDLATAIRSTAASGKLMTYGYLDRYYPVTELEGETCPDFKAPLLSTSVEQRLHGMLDDGKVNVLIFWSVDCPHCRKSLPQINEWLRANADAFNVVSAANVPNDTVRSKTLEFCEHNAFIFPTLVDKDQQIGNLYRVTSTPTILIIRPDGVVDSVIVSSLTDLVGALESKKRRLLGS